MLTMHLNFTPGSYVPEVRLDGLTGSEKCFTLRQALDLLRIDARSFAEAADCMSSDDPSVPAGLDGGVYVNMAQSLANIFCEHPCGGSVDGCGRVMDMPNILQAFANAVQFAAYCWHNWHDCYMAHDALWRRGQIAVSSVEEDWQACMARCARLEAEVALLRKRRGMEVLAEKDRQIAVLSECLEGLRSRLREGRTADVLLDSFLTAVRMEGTAQPHICGIRFVWADGGSDDVYESAVIDRVLFVDGASPRYVSFSVPPFFSMVKVELPDGCIERSDIEAAFGHGAAAARRRVMARIGSIFDDGDGGRLFAIGIGKFVSSSFSVISRMESEVMRMEHEIGRKDEQLQAAREALAWMQGRCDNIPEDIMEKVRLARSG